jgi:hypothetical protein
MNDETLEKIRFDAQQFAAREARIREGEKWCEDCGWTLGDDVVRCEDGQELCTRCAMNQGIRACTLCGAFDHWEDGRNLTEDALEWACHFCTVERADEVEANDKIGCIQCDGCGLWVEDWSNAREMELSFCHKCTGIES